MDHVTRGHRVCLSIKQYKREHYNSEEKQPDEVWQVWSVIAQEIIYKLEI